MDENNFILDLIASLRDKESREQVKEDIKNFLSDLKVPLIGTLSPKTRSQLKKDLASMDGTVNISGKVSNKSVSTSLQKATAQAQKQANTKPVEIGIDFSVKKEKLVNDIKLLAQQNSKLFKDTDMSIKYNSLLDNAEMARNSVELSLLRTQLGSLRSELKVTGNAGLTFGDSLKKSLSKVMGLFGNFNVIMQFKQQLKNAWTEAKELDKSMTDLSRVSESLTRSDFPEYLDRVISKTKQLAVAAKDYIDSVTTFSRAGYNLTDSETLADAAVQLEKVGDMSAVDASKALLAGLQGYTEIDGYGMDQLIEKAQALNDKIDIIGNTASISQKEVAQGIQAVGSVMSDANTSVDEFIALLGAGNRAVQDSDKVALAIRTSALRIRGCSAELADMGEEVDNVYTSASKLAEKIEGLTNINGNGGVKILEDDEETFRSIYDIYNDIAKVYDKMSDKDASALLDLIAGKNRSNQISAILQNMSEANELLERSLSAAGTASAEYEIYLNSVEAASERFGVAMTETYSNLISGETVKGLTNAGTAVLDFANSWNILEGTLKGFLTLGVLKGITTLTVAIKNSSLQISNYGKALDSVKRVTTYAQSTEDYAKAMNTLKSSCINLTDAQLKQVLANRNLEKSQLIEILQLDELEKEQTQARLAQLGLIQTTETQTVAQGAATASTFSLKAAMTGLGASIKAAWVANPIGITIMGISTAIGIATSAMSKYKQQLEETRQKNIEAATTASENANRLKDLYDEYTRLASIQGRTTSEEETFKTAVENITVALGNKSEVLKNLTAGTDEYTDALARATKEELQSQAVTATIGRKSAEQELQGDIWSDWKGSKIAIDSNSKGKALSNEAQTAVDIVSEALKEYETINRTWNNISWDISSDDPVEALGFYNALVEAREKLVLESEDNEALLDTEIYSDLNNAINMMSESLDTYIEKLYEEEKLNYMAQNNVPVTTEEYRAMESALVSAAGSSSDLQDRFREMLTADFSSLATGINDVSDSISDLDAAADTPVTFSSQLTSSGESLDNFQESIASATEAYSKLLSGDYTSSELLDCIQTINKAMSDMGGSINWESLKDQADSLGMLGDEIQNISQAYAESILSDVGIDVNSGLGQMLSNVIQQIYDTEAAFDSMNNRIDSIQSSYQTLTSILQSYNETGYINLDNLQALLTADSNLIAMLQVENGQLAINQSAYENLVAVQLLEFKAKLDDAAAAEIEALAKSKAEEATNRNADASDTAVTKLDAETAAFNRNTSAAISNAVAKAEESGVPTEDIQGILDKYNKVWEAAQNNYKTDFPSFAGVASDAKSAAKETEKEVDIMAELNSEMDKLQSAYESLCDIRDTYNKYGKITVDQYQQLTDMGFNFLANLVDENGELGLNASAFERLSHAKLQEMQVQMARNAIDTINGLQSEVEATEYLTYANENLRDAALSATEALLYQAQAAAHLRGEQQGLAADQIVQGYEASKMLASKVDFTFDPNETEKAAKEDKTDELLDAYNNEKKLLEHLLAMDQISKQEYYDRLMSLVYKYFDGDEEHKDQIWDVEESYHAYLESIKESYNWIEVFLNALAKKTSALIDKAEKFISWSKKNAMINRAVKATDREIKGQTNAYAYYAEQARKVKLPNGYISKIQNGTLTMEDMQNEALSDKIEKYQEWYDKMTECQDAVSALYDQERDLIKQKLDNVLDHYDSLDNYMSSIVSKMDSFISLMDDMGKRSSLTDLLEQFAAANEQLSHFQSRSENIQIEKEDTRFDSSKKVAEAKERDKQGSIDELNRQKDALTSVQDTGTYKKLLKEIEKAEAAYDKQYEKLWAIDPEKDPDGKKWDAAQKKLDKLSDKLSDLVNKKDELLANATADNVVEYAKVYDAYMKLYNKQLSLEEKGKELSQKDQDKMEALFGQMLEMDDYRRNAIKELEEQIGRLNGTVADDTEAEKIREQLSGIGSGVKDSATYKNLEKDIEAVQAKIDRFWETHDEATNAQQRQLDKWEAQLEAYYEKQNQLEDNATAETIGQYAKIYDAWKKLQDKIDAGKVLSTKEWKAYNEYGAQLEQFAEERASAEKDLYDQLEKALNPGDKIAVIEREYEEAAEGIYESYQRQIDDIKKSMTDSQQYKDLLAKTQNLEDIRDTKGLTAKQEAQLQKYKAELEALEKGATGDNISSYIQTWEKWYALQKKLDSGKKLSAKEAADYDAYKAQLDAWEKEKQTQISDLIDLMNDDLEKLRETNAENIAEAESEINSYYSNIYGLAKKIAEYNITALGEQLSYLDAYISYYKELVSLYDSFSGDKLSKLLTDLDEDVTTGQTEIYEKYLKTLEKKYDATLSQINEYRQLIDAVDTNDFQGSMDLFQKAMDDYNAAGNTEMAEKLKAVLDVLNERAVDADNWEEYADLWLNEWEQALADGKAELIGTAGAIQEVNDALREIRFSDITDALEELTKANEILSSMEGLIQEKWLYDKDGITEYGRAKAALLVSQLENAQTAAEQYLELYNKIIDNKDTYASEKAYKEALNEAIKNYYASINDAASLEESIMDLMKKSQEQELSSLKDIIEARKDALQKKKEYYDYSKKVSDSQKEIDSIRAQIDALENLSDATDAATKAKLAQLKADLEEKEEALKETKDEHTYSLQIDALDELADTLTDALDDSTKSVEEILKDQKETVEATKDMCQTSIDSVNETMDKIAAFYKSMGMSIDGIDLTLNGRGSLGTDVITVDAGTNATATAETKNDIVEAVNETTEAVLDIDKLIADGEWTLVPDNVIYGMDGKTYEMPDWNTMPKLNYDVEKMFPTEFLKQQQVVNQPVVNIHYDNMINVEGNVDEKVAKLLPQQLQQSYDYIINKMRYDVKLSGGRPIRFLG